MDDNLIRCVRCQGAKKLYKVGGGYCQTNNGGALVKCPLCLGEGMTKPLHLAVKDMESKDNDNKKVKAKRKSRAKPKAESEATAKPQD